MQSILDPSFRYTNSANTDIRKTFARVRREMRKQEQQYRVAEPAEADVIRFQRSAALPLLTFRPFSAIAQRGAK